MGMAYFKSESTTATSVVILEDWGTSTTYYIGGNEEYRKAEPDQEKIAELISDQPKEREVRHVTKPQAFDKNESDDTQLSIAVLRPHQMESTYG